LPLNLKMETVTPVKTVGTLKNRSSNVSPKIARIFKAFNLKKLNVTQTSLDLYAHAQSELLNLLVVKILSMSEKETV
jgi:hypothetical protein